MVTAGEPLRGTPCVVGAESTIPRWSSAVSRALFGWHVVGLTLSLLGFRPPSQRHMLPNGGLRLSLCYTADSLL